MENFAEGSLPVAVAAKVYGKDTSWVRAGIIAGWLPIGKLITRIDEIDSRLGRINFYISPRKLWEDTGYLWKGEKKYVNENKITNFTEKTVLD